MLRTERSIVAETAVRMRGISKAFNGVRVLNGVDFDVASGEIHSLVGGNGAGKSTLMKILEGVVLPDEGSIEIAGRAVAFHSSRDARAAGVAMIFQELSLVPTLTVAQNVFLTVEPRKGGLIDDREAEARTRALLAELGIDLDPQAIVGDLPMALRQLIEIAKALSQDARVLIMDEPTSSLGRSETEQLFDLMRRLRERGIAIVYISHRMEEVFEISDRITVLRDGMRILTVPTAQATMEQIINAIVGRPYAAAAHSSAPTHVEAGEILLEVRNLVREPRLRGVSFVLRRGEIVGLAGLMGSGRTELARAIFGIDRLDSGEILVGGRLLREGNPQGAMSAGIGLIPEDRAGQGLVVDHSIRDNLLAPILSRLTRGGIIDDRRGDLVCESFRERLQIKARSLTQPVRSLSGGNQQKVVIAKWLATEPRILLMDEPTAGVDVGTKQEIVQLIRRLANEGRAILLISSELPELLAAADRVLVMRSGRIERELPRTSVRSEEYLHHLVQGVAT
jgi:ribose transport system ATP-binding protein